MMENCVETERKFGICSFKQYLKMLEKISKYFPNLPNIQALARKFTAKSEEVTDSTQKDFVEPAT